MVVYHNYNYACEVTVAKTLDRHSSCVCSLVTFEAIAGLQSIASLLVRTTLRVRIDDEVVEVVGTVFVRVTRLDALPCGAFQDRVMSLMSMWREEKSKQDSGQQ